MSHEVEQIMYVGEVPWHKLGTRFLEPPTLEDAIVGAGLDWAVTCEPVFSKDKEPLEAQLTRRSSDNRILGVVGPQYTPLQNEEAFSFFKPFITEQQAAIECAGSLRQGERVFVLCKINRDPMKIKGNDTVEKYILLSNSHDGTLAVRVGFTPIRVVCANTLAMAHEDKLSKLIRIRHTKGVKESLENVREIMDVANSAFEATAMQYRVLANRNINTRDLEKYVKQVFRHPSLDKIVDPANLIDIKQSKVLSQIMPLFEAGRGNDLPEIKGTYWAAYNAITEFIQYHRGADDSRLDQTWFGAGASINKRALTTALVMAA